MKRKDRMNRRGIRGLKPRVGRECFNSRGGLVEQWNYTGRRSPRGSHCVTMRFSGGIHSGGSHSATSKGVEGEQL